MRNQALLQALRCVSITHHTPGRLRLDISSKIRQIEGLGEGDLQQIFAHEGVKECKINKILGKLTLIYDAQILPPAALENLLAASDEVELAAALGALNA